MNNTTVLIVVGVVVVLVILLWPKPQRIEMIAEDSIQIPTRCCGTPNAQRSSQIDFSINISTSRVLTLQYFVGSLHCSSIRLHIMLDGIEVALTDWLGYSGDPNRHPMSSERIDLSPISGKHVVTLSPEGKVGGCNIGTLESWQGIVKMRTSKSLL